MKTPNAARERMLDRIRSALGRRPGDAVPELSAPRLAVPAVDPVLDMAQRIEVFSMALEKLAGKAYVAKSVEQAGEYVRSIVDGRPAISSRAALLKACGVSCPADADRQRAACADAAVGITSAEFALADTGTLVMFSNTEEARLISLLPPVHIAVIQRGQILTGLDELLTRVPLPARLTSSMVLITGTSRTADIEQILVRGVHGPGEVHVVII
jgi:L-lactate dehydrogenase complex protein LldG